ncbi:MAG: zf-HC2 domain-containing protein [Bacteroidales bacterium]|nr:zf-HC2 domain-containing protein [Bacteroidales bacterium]MBN2821495.1 zf-HC2 domain-containing protein [Bacteroidales bacterium]
MLCKIFEKYIVLSDLNEISAAEQREFYNHLATCKTCREKYKQQEDYIRITGELREKSPEIPNPEALTREILSVIPERNPKIIRLEKRIRWLRIAALFIIGAFAGFYFQQSLYVKNQRVLLAVKYNKQKSVSLQVENYSICLAQSKIFIKKLMVSDEEFTQSLLNLASDISYNQLEEYTNTICLQEQEEFLSANSADRKKLILNFLQQSTNSRLPSNN